MKRTRNRKRTTEGRTHKLCRKCETVLPVDAFRSSGLELAAYCRPCSRAICVEYRRSKGIGPMGGPRPTPLILRLLRFWSRVAISTDADKCWEWTGKFTASGYGAIASNGKKTTAHRLAWEFANEREPKSQILHSCDNTKCVNPNHLREGTHQENMQDKYERGRAARGAKIHTNKLTEDQVREIRTRLANKEKITAMSKEFGVCSATIRCIKNRRTWSYLT